jgi:hypothetical protein
MRLRPAWLVLVVCWPTVGRRYEHANARHGHEVAQFTQESLCAACGLTSNTETLHQSSLARGRVARLPDALTYLTLNYGRYLSVAGDTGQVV